MKEIPYMNRSSPRYSKKTVGSVQWAQESCDLRDDPVSGARIIQLTSAVAISNNIYGEQPYCSPDGKRIVFARCQDFCWDETGSLLVHELDTLRITRIPCTVQRARGVFNSAWSGLVYFWTPDRKLMQLSLMTLEQKEVYAEEAGDVLALGNPVDYLQRFGNAPVPSASVSPDQRYLISVVPRLKGPGAPVFQIVRLDLKKNIREVIFEHPEISNPHLQFNPITGKQILVQHNQGLRLRRDGSLERRRTPDCKLFVIDQNGRNQRSVPVGPPMTAGGTGHECFAGNTGRILCSVGWDARSPDDWRHHARHPRGNLFTGVPGDKKPVCFPAPEHLFNHVSAARDGRHFVADSIPNGRGFMQGAIQRASLVIGNLDTGKYRVLVEDSGASGGGNQCTHTHPYLTTDNRYVIYNADPGGVPQVFAARLPDGFLASLE
jgi:hypothetical protein